MNSFFFRILSVFKVDFPLCLTNGRGEHKILLVTTDIQWAIAASDHDQYLGNCPPTPPLTQQQSIDNKLRLMLG